jgi:hypothetical protein
MRGRLLCLAVAIAGIALSASCGGDDDSGNDNPGGSGGTGGTTSGFDAPAGIACGQTYCTPPAARVPVEACCKDNFKSTCGVVQGSACIDQAQANLTGCPNLAIDAGPIAALFSFAGCCTADNKCGLNTAGIPLPVPVPAGCIELSAAADLARTFSSFRDAASSFIPTFPDPRPCP